MHSFPVILADSFFTLLLESIFKNPCRAFPVFPGSIGGVLSPGRLRTNRIFLRVVIFLFRHYRIFTNSILSGRCFIALDSHQIHQQDYYPEGRILPRQVFPCFMGENAQWRVRLCTSDACHTGRSFAIAFAARAYQNHSQRRGLAAVYVELLVVQGKPVREGNKPVFFRLYLCCRQYFQFLAFPYLCFLLGVVFSSLSVSGRKPCRPCPCIQWRPVHRHGHIRCRFLLSGRFGDPQPGG